MGWLARVATGGALLGGVVGCGVDGVESKRGAGPPSTPSDGDTATPSTTSGSTSTAPGDSGGTAGPTGPPMGRGADLDGDGFDDLAVSVPYVAGGGEILLFRGGAAPDGQEDGVLAGGLATALLGTALDIAGDLDADGFDDVVAGSAYVTDEPWYVLAWRGGPDPAALGDPTKLVEGNDGTGVFGQDALGGVGDFDGDGVDDLVAGSYTGRAGTDGRAYVIAGQGGGFDGSNRIELISASPSPGFGASAAGVGDLDGDGLRDVLVGAPFWGNVGDDVHADLFLGGDGGSDLLLTGPFSFGTAFAGAGDFDGDGRDDVLIGQSTADDVGSVHLYLGTDAGLTEGGSLEDGDRSFLGASVAGAGDVNGDGAPDLVAGAPFSSVSGPRQGVAYVFFGGTGDLEPDVLLAGGVGVGSAVGAADVNGDGLGDIVVSGQADYGGAHDEVNVYFGDPSFDDVADWALADSHSYDQFGYRVPGGFH